MRGNERRDCYSRHYQEKPQHMISDDSKDGARVAISKRNKKTGQERSDAPRGVSRRRFSSSLKAATAGSSSSSSSSNVDKARGSGRRGGAEAL